MIRITNIQLDDQKSNIFISTSSIARLTIAQISAKYHKEQNKDIFVKLTETTWGK